MATQSLIRELWFAQLGLLGFLTVVLLGKRAWKTFPFFTIYSLFNFVSGLIELFLYKSPKFYIYAFILLESVSVILGLAVAYEIFAHLFSSQNALRKLARNLLFAACAALVVIGIAVVSSNADHGLKDIASAVVITEEAARVLEVGLLAFLFICSSTFGLHWRQPVFGIALGLALFAVVELVIVTIRAQFVPSSVAVFSVVRMVAFTLSLITWISYLLVPERVTASAQIPDRSQLEQWNRAVMELIHQ